MNYLKLIRPVNLIMIALTMYLFRITMVTASPYKLFYIQHVLSELQFFLLVLSTVLVAAGGYVVNDIFDEEIDLVNRPGKVIVGQSISSTAAYTYYKILCAGAITAVIVLAVLTGNYRLSAIPVVVMVVLNFYAHTFKRQYFTGNFFVSLSAAFTILIIALFENSPADGLTDNETYVRSGIAIAALMYGGFAFLTTFLREIIKDIEDLHGDAQYGCSTIPVKSGISGAKIAAYICCSLLFVVLLSLMLFFPNVELKRVAVFIAVWLVLPLLLICFLIAKAKKTGDFHFISSLVKLYMLMGILTMLGFRSGNGPYLFVQYVNYLKKLV
jgi:4-hydroxybenzoate polyprenyltransferase